MGGSSDAQVVGYKYYAGMHMILCHGPCDVVKTFEVDKKLVWQGFTDKGLVEIDQPGIFGGESREGGIVGNVNIEAGTDTQNQNGYLQNKIKNDIPAFRGVLGIVLRGLYLGTNPYLKKWAFRVQRVFTRQNGIDQWYSAKAPIMIVSKPVALYISMDFSGSMNTVTSNGETRYTNMRTAMFEVLDVLDEAVNYVGTPPIDVMLVGWGTETSTRTSITRRDIDSSDITALKSWFSATKPTGYWTYFPAGTMDATSFFAGGPSKAQNVSFFVTDGQPTSQGGGITLTTIAQDAADLLFQTSDVQAYGFNIDLSDTTYTAYCDNTESDGVPVISGDNLSELRNTILSLIAAQIDLNPAHIIRECLTDPYWGMGYPEADIDDTAFAAAADTLFGESFGISLLWDKQMKIQDFITEIIRHIDAALYVDRKTGLFVLKLIREDYSAASLVTLDPSNTKKITGFIRPTVVDLTNSVTINFWNYKTGETSSVSVEDPALVQMQGGVNDVAISYPGVSNHPLARTLALRDCMTLSSPLIRGTAECNQVAKDFDIGDPFKLSWPDYDVDDVIVRVTGLSFGDGKNNRIKVSFTEDRFSFSLVDIVDDPVDGDDGDEWTEPGGAPLPVDYQLTIETTYYTAVLALGQTLVDDGLTADADAGYLTVAGVRPENGLNARLWVSPTGAGGTYVDSSPMEFCPSATLLSAVVYLDTTLTLENVEDLDVVVVGSYAQINDEIVSILAVDTTLETVTVGRGVLDTLPDNHAIGSRIFFYSLYLASDSVEYTATEEVGAKIATISSDGELAVASATEDTVTMDSRAIRPYPPAQIKIDSSYYPTAVLGLNDVAISWVGRDRTQQTAGLIDFTAGNIGPETSVTYTLKCYDETDSLVKTYTGLTGTSQTWTTEVTDSGLGRYNEQLRLVLYSVRGGYDSYQVYDYTFIREATPVNVTAPVITVL